MPRNDIWKDGIKSRFSRDNQPPNRGRKKGRPNRSTIARMVFTWIQEINDALDQQGRDHRSIQDITPVSVP